MFSTLLLSAALSPAAPVPKGAAAPPKGPPPQVVVARPDASGDATLTTYVPEKRTLKQTVVEVVDGKKQMKQVEKETTYYLSSRKKVADMAAGFATADGIPLTAGEAAARLKVGGVVLLAADANPIDAGWRRALARDALIVTGKNLGTARPATSTIGRGDPKLLLLVPDADGRVRVPVAAAAGGIPLPAPAAPPGDERKPLGDVAFVAYAADGSAVARDEALRRLTAGGVVLAAGALPEKSCLSAFAPDLLVLVSAEFGRPSRAGIARPFPVQVQPLPAVVPANKLPAKPAAD